MGYPAEFEKIDSDTDRLKVPGGWVVRTRLNLGMDSHAATHTLFIKDINHVWELENVD